MVELNVATAAGFGRPSRPKDPDHAWLVALARIAKSAPQLALGFSFRKHGPLEQWKSEFYVMARGRKPGRQFRIWWIKTENMLDLAYPDAPRAVLISTCERAFRFLRSLNASPELSHTEFLARFKERYTDEELGSEVTETHLEIVAVFLGRLEIAKADMRSLQAEGLALRETWLREMKKKSDAGAAEE